MHETNEFTSSVSLPLQKETAQPISSVPSPVCLLTITSSLSPRVYPPPQLFHMMPPVNNTLAAGKPAGKDESQSSTSRKASSSSARPQEPPIKCPRCDSPNTKFCYYNNYSLTQPRHFCKTCRRYWTKGGALRNVPIGGGCRKNKKTKSSPRLSGDSSKDSSSDVGGLKFFQGLSPAMDFQLGGINMPRIHSSNTGFFNQFQSFGDLSANSAGISASPNCFNLDNSGISSPLLGFSFPLSSSLNQETASLNVHHINLASSIESLSSINQDLHWRLQQQRLATLFVEDNPKADSSVPSGNNAEPLVQKPQPILFQNLENSKTESCLIGTSSRKDGGSGNLSTEWFFNNSYATADPTPLATSSSNNNLNDNAGSWSGIQAWSELTPFSSLP